MQLDDEVCLCFHITKRKILNFIRAEQPRVASQISECGGAGTGCGWCQATIRRYFAEAQAGVELDQISDTTPQEHAQARSAYIRAGGGTPPPGATPIE